MHPLARYFLVATPLAVLLFLALASFFTAWEGHAVSHRPPPTEDPAVYTVLIVTEGGDAMEVDWPADVVTDLPLDVEITGTPPPTIPDDAPATRKQRFALFFTVTPDEGESRVVPTTSPRAISGAIIAWVLGLALFNMWRSGSPFSWEVRARELPTPLDPDLQMHRDAAAERRSQSRKGPPPPHRRRGQGRRR
jgi:hypothetical protein